mmetsp:Transcript_28504/g.60149  ORF Transcript_28504/g.60149 Transcript_28504/m.60149 type:complete len:182 (+) Transcript_28504:766-1311(+)
MQLFPSLEAIKKRQNDHAKHNHTDPNSIEQPETPTSDSGTSSPKLSPTKAKHASKSSRVKQCSLFAAMTRIFGSLAIISAPFNFKFPLFEKILSHYFVQELKAYGGIIMLFLEDTWAWKDRDIPFDSKCARILLVVVRWILVSYVFLGAIMSFFLFLVSYVIMGVIMSFFSCFLSCNFASL